MVVRPTEADAARFVLATQQVSASQVTRFPTGLAHYVYAVTTVDQQQFVVRMALPGTTSLDGAVYWSAQLVPHGVPLPRILADDRATQHTPFPAILLEHLPGTDLEHVYRDLTDAQKRAIAAQIVQIQRTVAALPHANGYGYATRPDDPALLPSWAAVVAQSLNRSQQRISEIGIVNSGHVARVRALMPRFGHYLAAIPPQPFLDDTTTKNVLVANGTLSGIVDVDYVCFGDPLFTLALTRMALLAMQADLLYTDAWSDMLGLNAEQHAVVGFYTAVFCVDFLSEIGYAANREAPEPTDNAYLAHLTQLLEQLVAGANPML